MTDTHHPKQRWVKLGGGVLKFIDTNHITVSICLLFKLQARINVLQLSNIAKCRSAPFPNATIPIDTLYAAEFPGRDAPFRRHDLYLCNKSDLDLGLRYLANSELRWRAPSAR